CFKIVQKELVQYGKGLADKPQIIVATKMDVGDAARVQELTKFARDKKLPFATISAATGEGLRELLFSVKQMLQKLG
ncbi:MAG TPA: GTPase ObgE, partial [Acidobacteriota bacterium]